MQHLIGISGKKQHGKDTVARIIQYLADTNRYGQQTVPNIKAYLNRNNDPNVFGGNQFKTKQFAGVLKQMVCLMLGCTMEDLENDEFKNTPLGPEWDRWYIGYYKWENNNRPDGRVTPYFNSKDSLMEYWVTERGDEWLGERRQVYRQSITPHIILQELGTEGIRGIHPDAHVNMLFKDYKPSYEYNPAYDNKGIYDVTEEFEMQNEPMNPRWIVTDVRFPNEVKRIKEYGGVVIRVTDPRKESKDEHASETALDNYSFDFGIGNKGTIEDLIESTRWVYTKIQESWQSKR